MSRNGYQAYSFVRMKCKVILWSLRRISMQTLGAAFGSCASCCISPIVNKECRECLKYSCLDGLQMWKIWNSINHGWLINLLFGRRITHRSQQISKDYTDAYFLNGGRFYCGLLVYRALTQETWRLINRGRSGLKVDVPAFACCWHMQTSAAENHHPGEPWYFCCTVFNRVKSAQMWGCSLFRADYAETLQFFYSDVKLKEACPAGGPTKNMAAKTLSHYVFILRSHSS